MFLNSMKIEIWIWPNQNTFYIITALLKYQIDFCMMLLRQIVILHRHDWVS